MNYNYKNLIFLVVLHFLPKVVGRQFNDKPYHPSYNTKYKHVNSLRHFKLNQQYAFSYLMSLYGQQNCMILIDNYPGLDLNGLITHTVILRQLAPGIVVVVYDGRNYQKDTWLPTNRTFSNLSKISFPLQNCEDEDQETQSCYSQIDILSFASRAKPWSCEVQISLYLSEAKAEILGEPDKHVRSGSTFELVCVLRDSTEPPVYVFWYHNDRMINYDNVRGVQVSSDAEKSILTIKEAQKSDSGNYTCVPSNARPTSISVHILNGEKPAAMQHGSRSHSSRPSFSAPLLFVTAFVVFLLTAWLATTNQSQQNLFHLHHHQYKQEQRQKRQKRCCVPDTTAKVQQKVCTTKEQQPRDEITKIHWQTPYHHLYLQLLKKISEEFGKGVYEDEEKKGISHAGEETHFDNIKNETNSATTMLCILFLLEVKRRAVEISSKSNLKKPQAKSCLDSSSSTTAAKKATMSKSFPLNVGFRRLTWASVSTTVGKYSVLKNNAYEYCYPRRVVNVGKTESETKLHTTVATSVDDIVKVDQDHYQDHIHASLASVDVEEKRIVSLMMKRKEQEEKGNERIYFPEKWDSPRDWVDHESAFKPELYDNFQRRNIYMSAEMKEKAVVAENTASEFLGEQEAEQILSRSSDATLAVASGVAFQPDSGSKSRMGEMTTISTEISVSPSFVLSSCTMTFPKAYKRFVTTTRIITNNPTLTSSPSPLEKDFKLESLGNPGLVYCIVVAKVLARVVPVQVIVVVVVVVTRIKVRKEVDSSLQHHRRHHFSVLFPSACSYYSPTTSGLLVSRFPFLLISSSPVVTPRIMPTITTTPTTSTTATTTMNTSTTSFQPLFCLRNKAEAKDCLPQLLVKRLLRQPTTPPPSSPLEYYSVTVPTTNNNNITCKLPNILDCYHSSSFPTAQTVAR